MAVDWSAPISALGSATTVTQSFTWQVTAAGVAYPGDQTNTEGQAVSLQLAGGGPGLKYTATGLPKGLAGQSRLAVPEHGRAARWLAGPDGTPEGPVNGQRLKPEYHVGIAGRR